MINKIASSKPPWYENIGLMDKGSRSFFAVTFGGIIQIAVSGIALLINIA
jgi:hypothetical protein